MMNHKRRSLKIEQQGDSWRGKTHSAIRLKGQWLEAAGFKAGARVSVVLLASGVLQLQAINQ